MVTNTVSVSTQSLATSNATTSGLDHHTKRYRAYQWRQVCKMIGVVTIGLVGLFLISLVMLIR